MPVPKPTNRTPVPNPVPSFWNAAPRPLDDHRTTPDLPAACDIVIVGAGFAGVATAYHILKDNPSPPSITILEARKVCSGASGRNGGHVKPDTYFQVPKYTKLFGPEQAAKLAAFEASNVYAVKELVESECLDCDFHLTRAVDVYLDPEHAKETEAAYRELVKAGVVNMKDVSFTPKKDAERVSLRSQGRSVRVLLHSSTSMASQNGPPAPRPSPQKGAEPTSQHASDINFINTRRRWPLDNPDPARCHQCRQGRRSHKRLPHLVNTYGIRFDARNNDYLIPRADGSIVVGGARQMFWHKRGEWFDNVQDDELVKGASPYFDGCMQRHFRGWEESGATTERVWTGIMGYSSDFMPHLGGVPGKPGQFIIAGFSGHGMPEILLSSKGVAAMIRDGASFESTGLPRIMETSRARIERKDSPLEDGLKSLWEDDVKAKL
ncbi:FAD dependent oxidoreductase [Colletotrichum nymphaeae SA-01]|uniref:FAD dependent oxidoreductase n=1 Tax=Colletotrichum nymphaeae SA-01 TaxID=1460502 RepID=A0A135RRY8_9PEZI|nr:FAD dependent oxidoreductase [Colletotrichum nymphaeae SA-01]